MSEEAFVIEARGHAAGVAVRERGGFRFFAAGDPYYRLDQRVFRGLGELRAEIDTLAGARAARADTD
jgi:hypothetical protein